MLITMTSTDNDELADYLREGRAPQSTRLLTWWRDHHHMFPVPRHLAFEAFAAPASSCADLRMSLMAGNVVNDEQPSTNMALAEVYQGLYSRYLEGLLCDTSSRSTVPWTSRTTHHP
jgi:hypothetical protein